MVPPLRYFGGLRWAQNVFPHSSLSALLLTWAGSAVADQYRAEEFLRLDLSKAVLSPKRLGPPAEFAPVAVEARSDAPQMREEPSVDYRARTRTTSVQRSHSDDAPMRAEPKVDRRVDHKADRKVAVHSTRCEAGACREAACSGAQRNSCGGMAIRSMRRPWMRGSRNGRANPAASAAGSDSGKKPVPFPPRSSHPPVVKPSAQS